MKAISLLRALSGACIGGLLLAIPVKAGLRTYIPDANTLHLWHFDEVATPVADAAATPLSLTRLDQGATLGNAAFSGFGTALSTYDGGPSVAMGSGTNAYLAASTLVNGATDNIVTAFTGSDGAFTFEALVRIDFDPSVPLTTRNAPMQIISAEQDGTGGGVRSFQFRFEPTGFNPGQDGFTSPLASPALDFINVRNGAAGEVQHSILLLPVSGPNAVIQGEWYHVAVTYTGNADASGNLAFYWTRLDPAQTQAAILGTKTLNNDLSSGAVDWTIGNIGRDPSRNNFVGLIDEVRISGIARAPGDFVFYANADDTDGDTLPDAWEITFFGSLAPLPTGDDDGDGVNNADEYAAGSLPTNPSSVPPPDLATFIPIDDDNAATSEFGYAGGSNINTTAFICSGLQTIGDLQFMAYYGRHETDSAYTFNDRIWIGRRNIASRHWEVFRTNFAANSIADGHDVISFGFDGDGYLHLSWGMHGNPFHYTRSTTSVTHGETIAFGADSTMTGNESAVTYPQFLNLPNGDLLYLFREGASGAGDTYLNRYSLTTKTWSNVHKSGNTQLPFIKGTGWSPDYNAYPNLPCVDSSGNLTLTWTWRYNAGSPAGETGYQTNHDFAFARSTDGGLTWRRQDTSAYGLPISQFAETGVENTRAERILTIPEGSSLINQAGMCLDQTGQPVIASWWAPEASTGNHRRQYMVAFPTASGWTTRQVSHRTTDAPTTKFPESAVRDLGRPLIVSDANDRLIVIWRDNEGTNGLTVAYTLPRAEDPNRVFWRQFDLTADNLGNFEPVIDLARWQRDNVLHVVYQPSAGLGYTPPANTASPIGVLEWNAAAYFQPQPRVNVALINGKTDAAISFTSQLGWNYRLLTSIDLINWTPLLTAEGTGGLLNYNHPGGALGPKRFWRVEVVEASLPP